MLLWDGYGIARETRVPGVARQCAGRASDTRFGDAGFYRAHVLNDLLPFWRAHAPDPPHGGFVQQLDRGGAVTHEAGEKSSAMQARILYAFSAGYALGKESHHLALAHEAFQFLMNHLWDDSGGGWYQSAERDGRLKKSVKPLFSQAYGLVGVLEYYRATRDPGAARLVAEVWDLLDRHAWDGIHGGYFEACGPRWEVLSELKTSCVHLDLLGAAITTYELFGTGPDVERVRRLADLVARRLYDRRHGLLLEVHHRDWRYYPGATRDRVQVGHVLKGARSLLEAADASGDERHASMARDLADAGLRDGWDPDYGGFYFLVSRNGRLSDSTKLWWHQCEALAALARLAAADSESVYRETFLRLAEFCFTHLSDPEHGEWFTSCEADGRVLDSAKGGLYKSAYHTVAACLYTAQWLERWRSPTSL